MLASTADRSKVRRDTKRDRERFARARMAEREYGIQLRAIARHVGHIIEGFPPDDPHAVYQVTSVLENYANILRPWARRAAKRMLDDVARRDEAAWNAHAREMSRHLREELASAPIEKVLQALENEQVVLITSLPTKAAQRVHELTVKSLYDSSRAGEIAKEIMRSGEVTISRATLIARTEVGRAASALTEARASHIGSTHYYWRSAGDRLVRPLHKKLDGRIFRWDEPPISGEGGQRSHPGAIFNCFPASTLVQSGDALKLFRAFYEGPLVMLRVGETLLEATPNHPILTPRGWVAAGALKEGDDLLAMSDDGANSVVNEIDSWHRTFGEMYEALVVGAAVRKTELIDNFYGDPVHNEVEIVTTKENLALEHHTAFFQKIREDMIASADGRIFAGGIVGSDAQVLEALGACGFDERLTLFKSGLCHSDIHSSALISALDTMRDEPLANGPSIDVVAFGDRTFALASNISGEDRFVRECFSIVCWASAASDGYAEQLEPLTHEIGVISDSLRSSEQRSSLGYQRLRVTNSAVRHFSGHVFTLETAKGYYGVTAAGIVAKNCRCYPEPIIDDRII